MGMFQHKDALSYLRSFQNKMALLLSKGTHISYYILQHNILDIMDKLSHISLLSYLKKYFQRLQDIP